MVLYVGSNKTSARLNIYKSSVYLPGAFGLILLEVDIEIEAFFDVECYGSLTHLLLGLALALILRLTIICFLNLREVAVYISLNEFLSIASSSDEILDMRLVT